MKRAIAFLMVVLMAVLPLTACNPKGTESQTSDVSKTDATSGTISRDPYNPENDTLVIATSTFEGKFNPFYAESAYDQQIMTQVFVSPQMVNANNELVDWAGSITYAEKDVDGKKHVVYTVKVKEGMKFTDGEKVDIDDLLYSYYVTADPGYTGPSSTWATSTSIVGLKEYYYDDPDYSAKIADIEKQAQDKYSPEKISKEDFIAYLIDTDLEGWWTGDPAGDIGDGATKWADYIKSEGFETQLAAIDATDATAMLALLAEVEYEKYASGYDPYTYYFNKLQKSYISGNLENGIDVPTISGIVRVDDYTCTVEFYDVDIYGDRNVNSTLAPAHYYGKIEKVKLTKCFSRTSTNRWVQVLINS